MQSAPGARAHPRRLCRTPTHLAEKEVDPGSFVDGVDCTPPLENDLDDADLETGASPAVGVRPRRAVDERLVEVEHEGFRGEAWRTRVVGGSDESGWDRGWGA